MTNPIEIILVLTGTYLLAALTPGPNWALIIQHSMQSRKLGVYTAAGIVPAALCLATASMIGGSLLFAATPWLPRILQMICGCYLLYMGARSIVSTLHSEKIQTGAAIATTPKQAFITGFFCNITNPKSIAFFASMFAATNAYGLTIGYKILIMAILPVISFSTNCGVAFLISHNIVRGRLEIYSHWSKRVIGTVMCALGIFMIISR